MNHAELRAELKKQYEVAAKLALLSLPAEDAIEAIAQVLNAHSLITPQHMATLEARLYNRRVEGKEVNSLDY